MFDGFKEGLLDTLIIKNLKLPQAQMNNNSNMELKVLKALSNPAKNTEMYKSIKHIELTINNCGANDMNSSSETFLEFFEQYNEIFDLFSKIGLNKDTYIQTCKLEHFKLTTTMPN